MSVTVLPPMKIVLLAAASSIHTARWANGLSAAGHQVSLISQHPVTESFDPAVSVHLFPFRGSLGYFLMVPKVRQLLKKLQPDLVNAHYASGYGTTARLARHHPLLLSVWGTDVYDFPNKSPLHKWLVKKNLRAADQIASTSHCMAQQTQSLTPERQQITITPFGVDIDLYTTVAPKPAKQPAKLTIGTVKAMKPVYGVDTLIEAFALLVQRLKQRPELNAPELELRLVGDGEQTPALQALTQQLGIAEQTQFIGRVPSTQVPQELAQLDIYVALSRMESFGVAVIEAQAAGRPVVVSNTGGLPEVVIEGETGIIVPRENPLAAADALEKLILDAALRHRMGVAGQSHVAQNYAADKGIAIMLDLYRKMIKAPKSTGGQSSALPTE